MSYEYYRYCANPPINFFPRALKDLFKEEKTTVNGVETIDKKCELKDILSTYEDGNNYTLAEKKFKKIENRIYVDLGELDTNTNEYTVTKKVCVGFLAKHDDTYDFMKAATQYYALLLKCETDNNAFSSYLICEDQNNSKDPSKPISINLNNSPYKIKELSIVVKYSATNIPDNAKLKIYATYSNISGWSHTFTLDIYRNTENSLDGFKQSSGKDTDFFVLPRVNPSENQKECIKQLQIINNQVFARNASLTDFQFIEEIGEIEKTIPDPNDDTKTILKHIDENMEKNARNSLTAFKYDPETNKGCKSGNKISNINTCYIQTVYPYNFSNFGQQKDLIEYLNNEYSIETDKLQGRIYDRNFLFGNYKNNESDAKIEGIVNLYRKVVVQFINNFQNTLTTFQEFSNEWLSCPKYNKNYKRGSLEIQSGMNKCIYNNNAINLATIGYNSTQNNNSLPVGTIVTFKQGEDENAFNTQGENFYKIESVTIQGTRYPSNGEFSNYKIKLSLADKKLCNDREYTCNMGNYIDTTGLSDSRDILGVNGYNNYGIPYFINDGKMNRVSETNTNKRKKSELLAWNEQLDTNQEQIKNWYSYPNNKKPNTNAFGIDCSGLVINCLLWPDNDTFSTKFEPKGNTALSNTSAVTIGNNYSRKITTKENTSLYSYLTKGDIIYSPFHIVTCIEGGLYNDFFNQYVSNTKLNNDDRYINVIHNYGPYQNKNIKVEPQISQNKYTNNTKSYTLKTLRGPFKHCGDIMLVDSDYNGDFTWDKAYLGRIYLWSKYEN